MFYISYGAASLSPNKLLAVPFFFKVLSLSNPHPSL
nr:MAG TPA: hypothetical protein [Caudoviricetes sp.]